MGATGVVAGPMFDGPFISAVGNECWLLELLRIDAPWTTCQRLHLLQLSWKTQSTCASEIDACDFVGLRSCVLGFSGQGPYQQRKIPLLVLALLGRLLYCQDLGNQYAYLYGFQYAWQCLFMPVNLYV